MADVVAVAGEALWPSVHGGRIRMAQLVSALAERLHVCVAAPAEDAPSPGIEFQALPDEPRSRRRRGSLSVNPRLGHALLGPCRRDALRRIVEQHRPWALLFAHSYLAAMGPSLGIPMVVDFVDVEARRQASLAGRGSALSRAVAGLESLKALAWERQLARRAALAVATTPADHHRLSSWGARALLVPHGSHPAPFCPSPADGPVMFVASLGYGPNADAARLLVDTVWPKLRLMEPSLRLRIVGRDAGATLGFDGRRDGLEVVSDPRTVEPFYRDASLVLAPVRSGGGAQVKVVEALARCRVVIAGPFSARSAPPGTGSGLVIVHRERDLAAAAVHQWRDVEGRWAREQALHRARPVPSWGEACRPLTDAVAALVGAA